MNSKYKNLEKIFPDKKDTLLEDYEFAYIFFDTMLCLYYDAADEFNNVLTIFIATILIPIFILSKNIYIIL